MMNDSQLWIAILSVFFGSGFIGTLLKNRQVKRADTVEELGVLIDRLREEIRETDRKYDEIEAKYNLIKEERDQAEKEKRRVERENEELRERVSCLERKVQELERRLEA